MTELANQFLQHANAKSYTFLCAKECRVGAYALLPGDSMEAVEDGTGLYWLYCDWDEASIGRVPASAINQIAGKEIVPVAHYVGQS